MVIMPIIHMSEAEVARDLHALLAKVKQGLEIVIEQDHQPIAVLKPSGPRSPGRPAIPDPDFAKDVEAGIDSRRDSFEPPPWD